MFSVVDAPENPDVAPPPKGEAVPPNGFVVAAGEAPKPVAGLGDPNKLLVLFAAPNAGVAAAPNPPKPPAVVVPPPPNIFPALVVAGDPKAGFAPKLLVLLFAPNPTVSVC